MMAAGGERMPLAGERADAAARRDAGPGPVDPAEPVTVTVLLRRRGNASAVDAAALGRRRPAERELARIEEFARTHGLTVVESSPERRSIELTGRAADMCEAFGVELNRYRHPAGDFRGREGPVLLPAELVELVEGVFGLDDRSQAKSRFRIARDPAGEGSFTALQVAALYRFPAGLSGQGACIGIVELGGGYDQADLDTYFGRLGLPDPEMTAVSVDGAGNAPTGDPSGPDAEVLLDIEVAGAVAPAARIAVYFAPNSDRGFLDAVSTAVHDRRNAPLVLSISWGAPRERVDGAGQAGARPGTPRRGHARRDGLRGLRRQRLGRRPR